MESIAYGTARGVMACENEGANLAGSEVSAHWVDSTGGFVLYHSISVGI